MILEVSLDGYLLLIGFGVVDVGFINDLGEVVIMLLDEVVNSVIGCVVDVCIGELL